MEHEKNELITEGWVKFIRKTYVDGGTIDRWCGDCIDNPNSIKKSNLQLNSIVTYYRLNGGEWIPSRELFKMEIHWPMTDLTAKMIWENCYDEYQTILNSRRGGGN
jgi:hypothetical protein